MQSFIILLLNCMLETWNEQLILSIKSRFHINSFSQNAIRHKICKNLFHAKFWCRTQNPYYTSFPQIKILIKLSCLYIKNLLFTKTYRLLIYEFITQQAWSENNRISIRQLSPQKRLILDYMHQHHCYISASPYCSSP